MCRYMIFERSDYNLNFKVSGFYDVRGQESFGDSSGKDDVSDYIPF